MTVRICCLLEAKPSFLPIDVNVSVECAALTFREVEWSWGHNIGPNFGVKSIGQHGVTLHMATLVCRQDIAKLWTRNHTTELHATVTNKDHTTNFNLQEKLIL
jgi:hypothetical protein